ncbi:MAG: hypothetical protein CL534_25515 [Ahrensia sp.]|nr:hypothetical protein [Ahrensia sp.]
MPFNYANPRRRNPFRFFPCGNVNSGSADLRTAREPKPANEHAALAKKIGKVSEGLSRRETRNRDNQV